MKFQADILFDDSDCLFCPDLEEGFQIFRSWDEFLDLFRAHFRKETIPLYVYKADIVNQVNVFVDAGNLVAIPWDELENYL